TCRGPAGWLPASSVKRRPYNQGHRHEAEEHPQKPAKHGIWIAACEAIANAVEQQADGYPQHQRQGRHGPGGGRQQTHLDGLAGKEAEVERNELLVACQASQATEQHHEGRAHVQGRFRHACERAEDRCRPA
ncbi:MAG: hypothetical protein ACK56I_00565, partial [bacterium]